MNAPVLFEWKGDAMEPLARFRGLCDQIFVIGERYPLVVQEDRSQATHRHYFASIHDAWLNLPESIAERFPTDEHLRKWALIKSGYCDERSVVCASKAEAQRVAAFIRPMDCYAIVVVNEATIKVYTAQSQSTRAMGKAVFQKSKSDVLEVVSELIGVNPGELSREAGQAA